MKRLPNKFGSVYKLSGNRRKPYAARITEGIRDNGRPNYKYLGYYATHKEAIQALTAYNQTPYDLDLASSTIEDMWGIFKTRRFDKISESGRNVYKAAYNHLKPIHDKRINELKTYQLQTVIDGVDRSWQTKSHMQSLLHQLFEIAAELDIVQKNYAAFIKLEGKTQSNIHKAFTADEIKTLFNAVFNSAWADTVLIMIYTGVRPSELLGIKISDVHIDKGYMAGGLKTKAGRGRIIPINNKIMPFVRKRYNPGNTFLIEDNGKPIGYAAYKKAFELLMKELNMQHLPHDGRHTFASMADTAGMNKTAVKKIMGHVSSDITEKVYTHKDVEELLYNVNLI
jgi:integrase